MLLMSSRKYLQTIVCCCVALVILTAVNVTGFAQSIDANFPTPIRANTLIGRIAARDLGDARLTHHFYAFRGNPGDVLITVNSRNLNGDIDVFTATTLRPLLKLTLYAESTTPVSKGIYLRRPEDLILRVEARTPNDDEGTYQILFGGSFQPIEGGLDIAENETPDTPTTEVPSTERRTKRVSSVGARIDEPTPPVTEIAVATPSPEPTPEPTPDATPEARPVESPAPVTTDKPSEVEAPRSPRSTRNRRPSSRRSTTPAARPRIAPAEEAKTEPTEPATEPETKPAPRRPGGSPVGSPR